ncbi:ubiquitin protein ligase 6 isoform X2 [Wolffia australiana]
MSVQSFAKSSLLPMDPVVRKLTESDFLRLLLFFFRGSSDVDLTTLINSSRLLLKFSRESCDLVCLFSGDEYSKMRAVADYRVERYVYCCLQAVHHNRDLFEHQSVSANMPLMVLLDVLSLLLSHELPWCGRVVHFLTLKKGFSLFRDILLVRKDQMRIPGTLPDESSLEHVIYLVSSQIGLSPSIFAQIDPRWSFSTQILSIPFLWKKFPYLKKVFQNAAVRKYYLNQMALYLNSRTDVLPVNTPHELPGYACLLGNLLEASGIILSAAKCDSDLAIEFTVIITHLLGALPSAMVAEKEVLDQVEDALTVDEEYVEAEISADLKRQITSSIDSRFLQNLVNALFGATTGTNNQSSDMSAKEVSAVGAVCSFLHVAFTVLPLEQVMTGLAYRTELVHVLWSFIKRCHGKDAWPTFSDVITTFPSETPGWLIPLAIFCPVYKHILMIVDNEELYEQEKPLPLNDICYLVAILKEVLWQLLWVVPVNASSLQKPLVSGQINIFSVDVVNEKVVVAASELMTQLRDWNSRRPFASAADFNACQATDDSFIAQAIMTGNSRALDILKRAPFLVPFNSRVKLFTSQLLAARQRNADQFMFSRNQFRIRRDRIFEDAFNQLSHLSEKDLRGLIRIVFINELGVEEAGVDGGGIFKDFMENVIREAFDIQYGLFKETADHLLYPNPGSALVREQHLQFFHFLGTLLGKAMFEGILVDLPFALFFLSKLKQKHNYLNDLPSLDPELYRHLLFLKHYQGNISELELYFVIVNNEYGEQKEEELIPGGRNKQVTNENVIMFIHLVANHRLNFQIRQQSLHFLRGFQQLIKKEWIEMFSEDEIQLLISGSLEVLDVDDLRANTQYAGGYHPDHECILAFWEVLKSFSLEHKKKFLKFVTGCSRGPLLGFKHLEPKLCIRRSAASTATEEDLNRLPTSATCMNLLKLPPYKSKEQMRTKLMYAINAEAGFDLS